LRLRSLKLYLFVPSRAAKQIRGKKQANALCKLNQASPKSASKAADNLNGGAF